MNQVATSPDLRRLFAARGVRLLAYGAVSIVLVFYLLDLGLTEPQVGLVLTLTLVGDAAISLGLASFADAWGRRRTLLVGAALMAAAGVVFAAAHAFWLLVLAATVGVISPSGQEVGPFMSIEQAALSQVVPASARTRVLAWYTLVGSFASALGALGAGWIVSAAPRMAPGLGGNRLVVLLYAVLALGLAAIFATLSPATEAHPAELEAARRFASRALPGLGHSRPIVLKLSALFALDALGGGFVVQSLAAYWFHLRFGAVPAALGGVFFAANVLAGLSALVASRLAARIGLVRTMVLTHLPSNILLVLVPLMPTMTSAVAVLLVRFSISQMDVPARQSYIMAVVTPAERSAAAGVTGVARTLGSAVSPMLASLLLARPALASVPFILAGTVKIAYDVLLYRRFRDHDGPN